MKVVFTTCFPSPYRMDFYNELGKHCDLTVLAEESTKDKKHRNAKWLDSLPENFTLHYLKSKRFFKKVWCFEALKLIAKNQFDVVVIGGYSTPTEIMLILYLYYKKIPFAINADGGMVRKENFYKYYIKKFLITKADFWLCTGHCSKESFLHYGADEQNIYIYPFTSLRRRDIPKLDDVLKKKQHLKKALGLKEPMVVMTVGQFIYRKANDVLIKAASELNKSIGIYIIGGKVTNEYINIRKAWNLEENVHFLDFKTREELKRYYDAADLFVLPTREDIWGLVVNEAMAHGLPVITTDQCVAGRELITNDINGYIVPVENSHIIAEKIKEISSDYEKKMNMASENYHKVLTYTIENMAAVHMNIFYSFLHGMKAK